MKTRRATLSAPLEPRVRRAYFDCRYGQLHVHYALPAGGGFDEATALLCIPGAPGSGRFFGPLLLPLGRDRSVYAPDLPGCGESDGASASYTPSQLAEALGDFLDSMHLTHFDLLAHESGVAIAAALLQQRPAQIGPAEQHDPQFTRTVLEKRFQDRLGVSEIVQMLALVDHEQ